MMQTALSSISSDLFKQPVAIIGGISVLLYMDWKFTIVTLVLFPSCLVPLSMYGKRARKAVNSEQEGMAEMVVTMQESFAGIRVDQILRARGATGKGLSPQQSIAVFQFDAHFAFDGSGEPVGRDDRRHGCRLLPSSTFMFENLPAAKFIALIGGIFLLYEPIKTLSRMHITMQRSIASTIEYFRSPGYGIDRPRCARRASPLKDSQGQLDFERVTFRYSGGKQDAVKDFNLRIEPGKSYALVGASGAGKSTILSLILRLYDPTAGAVRIDGHDLRSLTQRSLRKHIGLVSQDTFLFHDTILKNIQFGRLDATKEEIQAAAKAANAHDFIMAQPKGYETLVGDKGCLLSGGQQQRLAIARALLKNAPILLLDEATSALDSESEQQIQLALERLAQGRTVIAIAHRLSTILSADQIVVMEKGRIKEIGTHAELLENSGYYRRLYDLQFNRNPEEPGAEVELLAGAAV